MSAHIYCTGTQNFSVSCGSRGKTYGSCFYVTIPNTTVSITLAHGGNVASTRKWDMMQGGYQSQNNGMHMCGTRSSTITM